MSALLLFLLGAGPAALPSAGGADELLPARVQRVVVHVLGGPAYDHPELRFVFFTPHETQALWKRRFGAHWIVWTDGSLWPRHPAPGAPPSWMPDVARPAQGDARRRIAAEARTVYAHLRGGNSRSVGIEVAHSGRADDPFPPAQLESLAWLVRTLLEMSGGRLSPASVSGHKDLDRRPAYAFRRCQRAGCPVFVDAAGRPFRRRVDPPESLFAGLHALGLPVPRPADADTHLRRAQALGHGARAERSR